MKTKYYVSIGETVRVLVLADNPIEAITHSLSYMGFNETTEVPKWMLDQWPDIIVDERGFRDYTTMDEETIVIEVGEALDGVDECFRYYDPFCEFERPKSRPKNYRPEDDYYFGLGEPE